MIKAINITMIFALILVVGYGIYSVIKMIKGYIDERDVRREREIYERMQAEQQRHEEHLRLQREQTERRLRERREAEARRDAEEARRAAEERVTLEEARRRRELIEEQNREDKRRLRAAPKSQVELYIEWCARRLEDDVRNFSGESRRHFADVMLYSERLRETSARRADMEVFEAVAKRIGDARVSFSEKTFAECAKRREVARIEVKEYGWMVVTTPLLMKSGGKEYRLGKVEIHLRTDGRVRIFNQTKRITRDGEIYDHPRVRRGEPLLSGDERTVVIFGVVQRDLILCIDAVISFLIEVPERERTLIGPEEWPEEVKKDDPMQPML